MYFSFMKRVMCGWVLFFAYLTANAQFPSMQWPLETATGYTLYPTVFSQLSNPSSLVNLPSAELGLLVEKRFLLRELSMVKAAVAIPVESGAWSMAASFKGSHLFSESGLRLSYARRVTGSMTMGCTLEYVMMRTAGYRNITSPRVHFHLLVFPSDKISAGFYLQNPIPGLLRKATDYLPAPTYSVGVGYDGSEFFSLSFALSKEAQLPLDASMQLRYRPTREFQASLVLLPLSGSIRIGAGWRKNKWGTEVFAAYHARLGLSPALQFVYMMPGKEE
jgi:hypothetical protein